MAFNISYIGKASSGANSDAGNIWTYNGSATGSNETLATIVASAYFNSFQQRLTATAAGPLTLGDTIIVDGNDANGMYKVSSITTNVTLAAFAAAGGDVALVQHARVIADLATFIALYATPIEVVAAPAAGSKLVLQRLQLSVDYGGVVLANGGALHVQYDSTANGAGPKASGTLAAATLIAATADTTFGFTPVDTTLVDSTTLAKNLSLSAATANFTGGTGGAYIIDVWYSVVDLS